jgi:type IV pilus assembly protein PilV
MMTIKNQQKGFTLIEVLIAITLLVIGILAVASMQISSLGGNSNAIRITEASTWAGDKLETLMARPYNHADLIDDNGNGVAGLNDTDVAGSPADGGPEANGAGFTVFWNVADNTPVANCKTIRVIVRRSDKWLSKTISFDYMKVNES